MIEYYGCSLYEQEAKCLQDLEEIIGGPPTIIEESKTSKSLGRFGVILEENHIESLQIFNVGLSELPESIGGLTELKSLRLNRNPLTTLPEQIGNLTHLESLELSYNYIKFLPENIGKLRKLRRMNLRDNPLNSLPDSIGDLSNLEFLHISNYLSMISDDSDYFMRLLTQLPKNIGKLTNLKRLFIGGCNLTSIP